MNDRAEPDPRTLADVSALADGTLDPGRVPEVRDVIASSPELSRRYEREREAVTALHALRADRAPAGLRLGVDALRRPARPPRRRLVFGGALAGAVAAVVAALVLLLPGGTPGAPSVSQAAALSLQGPVMAAPLPDRTHPTVKLRQDVEEVYFPNWSSLGWRAVGQRVDRFGHRMAVTVYYQHAGVRIAYTILAAPALRWPGTPTQWIGQVKLQSFGSGKRVVVTWRRDGHTCILAGSGVGAQALAELAAGKSA
ncbi:MAG: hypothetical protein JO244_02940 [Solirubrobacterales bacterium]|nr:hypothetical protein [Solirubrobacterales bacterium]